MNLYGRWSRWAAALALALAGLIGVGAATVLAAPSAGTAASAFELTADTELISDDWMSTEGTFRSGAPFCASGRFVEFFEYPTDRWRLTCADGTGSLTVALQPPNATWWIEDGSGSYTGLRGKGLLRGEWLCGENCVPFWRSTFQGVVDWGAEPDQPEDGDTVAPTNADTIAPTIAIASARATKLRRPAGAYSIKVALALRDDVEGNPVSYRLRVATARGIELTRRFGTATTGAVSMTLRIRPPDGARLVRLQLTGVDPVGNSVSTRRGLSLPR